MEDELFDYVLEQASATPVAERCRGLIDLVLRHSQASAVSLVSVSSLDGGHREMLSVDYSRPTADYLTSPLLTRRCSGFRQVVQKPATLQTWDDLPDFTQTHSVREVLRPAGFNNGISLILQGGTEAVVGVFHVSVEDEFVNDRTRQVLESVRPLLANWVVLLDRFETAQLSVRESEVLTLIRDGLSNAQIATELFVSQRTVSAHVESILRKLAASNRTEAAVLAERAGITRQPAA